MAKKRKGGLDPAELAGLRLAVWISLAGYILGGYLVLNHFGVSDAAFCKVGEFSDCDLVNRSEYSKVLGIPVALMGASGFLAVAFFAAARLLDHRSWLGTLARPALSAATVGGICVGIYLTLVELLILHTVCLLCVTSFALFLLVSFCMRRTLLLPFRKGWKRSRGQLPVEGG